MTYIVAAKFTGKATASGRSAGVCTFCDTIEHARETAATWKGMANTYSLVAMFHISNAVAVQIPNDREGA